MAGGVAITSSGLLESSAVISRRASSLPAGLWVTERGTASSSTGGIRCPAAAILSGIDLSRCAFGHARQMERQDGLRVGQAAILRQIGSALDLTFVDAKPVRHLAFEGQRQRLAFVALSDSSTQTGGFRAVSIGLQAAPGDGQLVFASEVFSPLRGLSAQGFGPGANPPVRGQRVMMAGIGNVEFGYFGAKDATSPAQWHAVWNNAGQMPALVSGYQFSRQGRWRGGAVDGQDQAENVMAMLLKFGNRDMRRHGQRRVILPVPGLGQGLPPC